MIVRLHEAEAFGRRNSILFSTPECHHAPARDHFETPLLVGGPHVAAINPHRHGTIRQGQIGIFFRFHRIGLPFFA
ncbi:MAG: hypothetical protein ACRD19_10850 [Terriglobia bacterium]